MSDWDRLNDFLRFVLDKGENTQHARTTNPKSTHARQLAYPEALHNNQIQINTVFHTAVLKVMPVTHKFKRCYKTWPLSGQFMHAKPICVLT